MMIMVSMAVAGYEATYTAEDITLKVTANDKAVSIEIINFDIFCEEPTVAITIAELDNFVAFLESVRAKHIEWAALAKENKVESLTKIMPTNPASYPVLIKWKFGDKTHFPLSKANMRPIYVLDEKVNGSGLFVGEVVSMFNQFVKFDNNMVFMFTSTDDIDSLIAALDKDAIMRIVESERAKKDLFK